MRIEYILHLLLGCCLGAVLIYSIDARYMRKQAIQNECGHYDYHTGEFSWNVNESIQTAEKALSGSGLVECYTTGGECHKSIRSSSTRESSDTRPLLFPAPVVKTQP